MDAGGAEGGVGGGVAEAGEEEGGEDFGEVGGEGVAVGGGEEAEEADAVLLDGGFVGGGGGGGEAGEEGGEGVWGEGEGDGVELGGGAGEGVAVGELGEAEEDSLFEVSRGSGGGGGGGGKRHCRGWGVEWWCCLLEYFTEHLSDTVPRSLT